jgi:mannose-6-phosphate isomerase-like protein (cupin superfamily)
MSIRGRSWGPLFTSSLILFISAFAFGQEMSGGRNVAGMKLTPIPPLPTCAVGSVQNGDPGKGPSIIFAKIQAGCVIPWHWHTPSEHLMFVSGVARVDMKDGKPLTLRSGGFAMLASKHVHQFTCQQACQFYVYSDAAFDLHYVDKQGNEIQPPDALKAVREKVAPGMK